jgi:hypothetical protein
MIDDLLNKYYMPIKVPDMNREGLKQALEKLITEKVINLVDETFWMPDAYWDCGEVELMTAQKQALQTLLYGEKTAGQTTGTLDRSTNGNDKLIDANKENN